MTEAEVRKRLETAYKEAGSFRILGKQWKMSPTYLCYVSQGERPFNAALLKRLGVRIVYEDVDGK